MCSATMIVGEAQPAMSSAIRSRPAMSSAASTQSSFATASRYRPVLLEASDLLEESERWLSADVPGRVAGAPASLI